LGFDNSQVDDFSEVPRTNEKKQKPVKSGIQGAASEVSRCQPLSLREVKRHWQCWDLPRARRI